MTRPLRIEYAGAVYHITSRGNEKKPVFKDDQDRINFQNTLHHVNMGLWGRNVPSVFPLDKYDSPRYQPEPTSASFFINLVVSS
jgi:hypothetical protein